MWVLLAFLSAFFAGITAILAKCGIKKTDSDVATFLRTCVVLLFAWGITFISGSFGSIAEIGVKNLCFLVVSGFFTGASWLCYFKALSCGDINKIAPIDKSSTALTMILAFIFFGEFSLPKFILMAVMLAGTLLMVAKKKTSETEKSGKWLLYAVLSTVFASLTSITAKIGITDIPSDLGTAIRTVVVLVMAFVVVCVKGKTGEIAAVDKKELLFLALSGFATGASWLCYYTAMQTGDVSVVVPIDKLSLVVTVVFSYFVFGEKLTKRELLGFLLVVSSTLLLVFV